MSVHKTADGRWFSYYRDETGKQNKQYFGHGPAGKIKAETFDLEIKLAKKRGHSLAKIEEVTFLDLAQDYINHCRGNGKSESFINQLKLLLNNHLLKLIGDKPVDEMTYLDDMFKIIEYYKDRSQNTRNRYLSYLKAIFRFGIEQKRTVNDPLQTWHAPREARRQFRLTVEDLGKIMDAAGPHLRWALEVEFNLGTRPGQSELLALKWSDIDFKRGSITFFGRKTQQWRTIPLRPEFLERLKEMKDKAKSEYIVEFRGQGYRSHMKTAFTNAIKKAGINYDVRMYDLRHLFASTLLSNGADLAAVSKLLGHSSIKMTADTYYHVMAGEKERAVNLLPVLPKNATQTNDTQKRKPSNELKLALIK